MSTDKQELTFDQLDLAAPLLKAVKELGYERPSPIQAEAIPHILNGHDILGQAQTGTGKTAAFALPFLSKVDLSDTSAPQVLVLAPTRELAIQVAEAFQTYSRYMPGLHVLPIYGGSGYDGQLRQLKRGVHVVVGTPGRVMDHIKRKTLKLHNIKAMILDEADEMLRMGFIDDVEWVLDNIPEERQIALFSATMPPVIRKVANKHLNDPKIVKIESSSTTNAKITQSYLAVKGPQKLEALTRILEAKTFDGVIIFVRTKNATTELAEKLEARGYSSAPINGDIVQKQRERTIERLKKGSLDILVATDVAARGIDVERVTLVINYDIPYDAEAYTHRIGRTGRAGREGEAIMFVAPREQRMLQTIERTTRQKIEPMQLPSVDKINEHRLERFKQKITDAMVAPGIEPFYKLVKEFQEENDSDPVNIAAALAKLLQGDEPLFLQDRPLQYQESSYDRNDRGGRERNGRDRDRGDRNGRDRDRSDRPRRERTKAAPEGMTRFRISVGRNHKVKPGNIVGAIANEGGIDSKNIGPIEIHDGFSTVDLPQNLNRETINTIGNAWVCGQKMSMVPFNGDAPAGKPSGDRKDRGDRGDRSDRSDNRGNRGDAGDATKKAVSPFKKNKDASSKGKKSYKDNPISKGKPKSTLKIEK